MVVVLSSFEFTGRLTQTVFYHEGQLIFTDSWRQIEYNKLDISEDV